MNNAPSASARSGGSTPREDGSTSGQKKVERINTYLPIELFKIVLIAPTKERTEEEAQWITGPNSLTRGVYMCNHLKTKIAIFTRWPGMIEKQTSTVSVELLAVYIKNKSEWDLVKEEAAKYKQIPIRVIVTEDDDIKECLEELEATRTVKAKDSKTLRIEWDKMDREEYKRLKKKFMEFDEDNSGSIEKSEMAKIGESLGFDPNDKNFIESLYALDLNGDGEINLAEFVTWWKVGRQNTTALPKIYHLNEYFKDIMQNFFNLESFSQETQKLIESNENSKMNQTIYFRSPGEYNLKSFIEGSIAFGGPKRQQEAENFLKRFTTNVGSQKLNWISILFRLGKKNKISGEKGKQYLENFKEICLQWAESKGYKTIVNFLRNMLIFETSCTDNAVIMAIRLKTDIEELVKGALLSIGKIVDALSTKTESAFLSFRIHSNEDLVNSIKERRTVEDFFKVSELKIKTFGFRKRLRSFFSNISREKINLFGMLQFLFIPYDMELNVTGDMGDITDPSQRKILDMELAPVGLFLSFLKENISSELLQATDDIDIAFNAYDLFWHLKFYTEKMFKSSSN